MASSEPPPTERHAASAAAHAQRTLAPHAGGLPAASAGLGAAVHARWGAVARSRHNGWRVAPMAGGGRPDAAD